MARLLAALLSSLSGGTKAQLVRENRFLKVENEVLRSKLKDRVVVSPEDRARLVSFGREAGPAIDKLISIVQPETFKRWLRMTPGDNAHAEAWVASLKRECLDYFTCFGRRHLDHVLKCYANFYNRFRPHQGKGNKPLRPVPAGQGEVRRQEFLGGLLSHYYREAGWAGGGWRAPRRLRRARGRGE
jgi:hypothetical protein